jgi:hypothetical protein
VLSRWHEQNDMHYKLLHWQQQFDSSTSGCSSNNSAASLAAGSCLGVRMSKQNAKHCKMLHLLVSIYWLAAAAALVAGAVELLPPGMSKQNVEHCKLLH